jgi:hypothetical protein
MADRSGDIRPIEDPTAHLERALIEQFIRTRGYDPARLKDLKEDERRKLLRDASAYAAAKLAEVESRAHYVDELHGER